MCPPQETASVADPKAFLGELSIPTRNVNKAFTKTAKDGKRLEVRGKLKAAIDAMVFGIEGGKALSWIDAAKAVGYPPLSMRRSMERPHVRDYIRQQKEVFRASASAQNISRAVEIRDQDENKTAAMQAMRYLDGIADEQAAQTGGSASKPGVVIVINADRPSNLLPDQGLIEINPLAAMPSALADE